MSLMDASVHGPRMSRADFAAEWKHTWVRHNGYISLGAPIFETTPDGLARRLYRLRADGFDIDFTDDTKALRP